MDAPTDTKPLMLMKLILYETVFAAILRHAARATSFQKEAEINKKSIPVPRRGIVCGIRTRPV